MSPERPSKHRLLTDHLDIWAAADTAKKSGRGRSSGNAASVYGIKKLRELILELAVRGKLVPQDSSDEPTSELLKRIQVEKAKLIAEGKIKKDKPLPPITEEEKPHALPNGWTWVRNGFLFSLRKGRIPKNLSEKKIGLPYLDIEALDRGVVRRYTDDDKCPQSNENDILVVCDGSRSGLVLDGKVGAVGSTLSIIDTPIFIQPLVKLIFKQGYERRNASMKGAAIPHLDTQKLVLEVIALPPLAEQHHIVAKVEELMAMCDQLEQEQTDSSNAHQTLVETLLATLTQAEGDGNFAAAWQRIAEHFDALFTTEQSIAQLMQTILQLAVMGKLVSQDPNDEPVDESLALILSERASLITSGRIRKEKALTPNTNESIPFALPDEWRWKKIGDTALFSEYGISHQTFIGETGVPVLKMGDIQGGQVILGGQKKVSELIEELPPLYLDKYDLLYNRTNSAELVGKTGIYLGNDSEYTFASYLIRIRFSKISSNPVYFNLAMNAPFFRKTQIFPCITQQCGQANVNGTMLKNMIVPIPPLAEQHRIVAKVDELMAICDALKARLNDSQNSQVQLADAIVEQAVV